MEPDYGHNRFSDRLFWCLLCLNIVPLFFGRYFPTQDGPSHLYNADILKELLTNPHSAFHLFYTINAQPSPNWLVSIIFAVLLSVLPAFLAEKMVLVAYIVLLPLAFRFVIRQINSRSGFIALLIFPFLYNITFYLGFFNFCFSLILFCYTTGYWIKNKDVFDLKKQVALLVLVSLTYFTHPVSFVLEAMMMGFLWLAFLWADMNSKNPKAWKNFAYRFLNLLLAFLPMLVFLLIFVSGSASETDYANRTPLSFLKQLAQDYVLSYMSRADLWLCTILAVLIALLIILNLYKRIKDRAIYPLDMLFVFWLLFLVMAYFSPESLAGGSVILVRLILYANLLAVIWLAVLSYSAKGSRVFSWIFFGIGLAFILFRASHFWDDQKALANILAVEKHISNAPNHPQTILPFTPKLSGSDSIPTDTIRDIDINVFQHTADYISIDRGLISLQNYEASSGYFPIIWKPGYDPSAYFTESGDSFKISDLDAYRQKTGIAPDYILISSPDVPYYSIWQVETETKKEYRLLSSASMDVRLYKRK